MCRLSERVKKKAMTRYCLCTSVCTICVKVNVCTCMHMYIVLCVGGSTGQNMLNSGEFK